MARFRRKVVEVEAVQYTGDNIAEVVALWSQAEPDRPIDALFAQACREAGLGDPETHYEGRAMCLFIGEWALAWGQDALSMGAETFERDFEAVDAG